MTTDTLGRFNVAMGREVSGCRGSVAEIPRSKRLPDFHFRCAGKSEAADARAAEAETRVNEVLNEIEVLTCKLKEIKGNE